MNQQNREKRNDREEAKPTGQHGQRQEASGASGAHTQSPRRHSEQDQQRAEGSRDDRSPGRQEGRGSQRS